MSTDIAVKNEVLPVEQTHNDINNFPSINSVFSCSTSIVLTQDQEEILYKDVDDEYVEIRPDGLVYLPWMEYVTRLRKAFGMSWSAVPDGKPKREGNYIYWPFYLIVKGVVCGYAIGEQEYRETNRMMTWGDACEGAKSNALMRLCKGIGIGLELWKPSFVKAWKEKYAETYMSKDWQGKNKLLWRKKGSVANDREEVNEAAEMVGEAKKALDEIFEDKPRTVVTSVENIMKSPGINQKTKKAYLLYKITGEGEVIYNTFDENFATLAKTAKEAGLKVEIKHKGDKFNTIEEMQILEPNFELKGE